jgi:uncharacterized cupredoxin-like copper-binding protein
MHLNPSSRGLAAGTLAAASLFTTGCGGSSSSSDQGSSSASTPTSSAQTTPAPSAPAGRSVAVTLKEFTVAPIPPAARAGQVTFRVKNAGAVQHEFVVLLTPKRAADLLKGSEADESGNVGEIADLPAGSAKSVKLNLKPGHYALICNLPGHYQSGQYADFTVR